jgi:cell division protein FtsB
VKKLWLIFLFVMLGYLQYRLWFSANGLLNYWRLQQMVEQQHKRNQKLEQCNHLLRDEIKYLRESTEALEERARYELDMIRPGEVYVQIGDEAEVSHRHAEIQDKCGSGQ